MAETKKKNKRKKIIISEEDIALLLRRYPAATIISLLQEVAQFGFAKIDWNALVKKTSTGITNAREYQMVWRHLAYRHTLLENVDDGALPLDDDSDLESDLEAFPPVSGEVSLEAAACTKVLLGSGLPSDSSLQNFSTVEAPMTINIPNAQASPAASDNPQPSSKQGKHITVPVLVNKNPVSTSTPADAPVDNKRRRKPWTEEEDLELIAAVQKCGERNWATIVKGDFKGDRTASQLSQRWSIIRRRQDKLNPPPPPPPSQLTEAQLATRRAVSHALNMPMVDNLLAARSTGGTHSSIPSSSTATPSTSTAIPSSIPFTSTPFPSTIPAISTTTPSPPDSSSPKSHPTTPKPPPTTTPRPRSTPLPAKKGTSFTLKSLSGPNPTIQATAVAAGARIATPSDAASLLKATQFRNVVHIRPGTSPMIKTPVPVSVPVPIPGGSGSRPNVHYIRTGMSHTSALTHQEVMKPQMATCSLPTLPSQQMTPASLASAVLCANEGGKSKSEEMKVDEGGSVSEPTNHQKPENPAVVVVENPVNAAAVVVETDKCSTATAMEEG